jgi:cytochrome b involved in lipid metabolism
MSESLTTKQVAEHNTVEKGLYIIVDGDVYKMDTFVEEHPGGSKILKRVGGKDASKQFWKVRLIPFGGEGASLLFGVNVSRMRKEETVKGMGDATKKSYWTR